MPNVIIVAGANGAGKSTLAPYLLRDSLKIAEYVNADTIALGLAAFAPESVALEAGRVMLKRLNHLAMQKRDFAFETTLASRSYARWLRNLKDEGYQIGLIFLWLCNADLAVARVRERVRLGGHNIPEATVRRRYNGGLQNFFNLYQPLADSWRVYDVSSSSLVMVASGNKTGNIELQDGALWTKVRATR